MTMFYCFGSEGLETRALLIRGVRLSSTHTAVTVTLNVLLCKYPGRIMLFQKFGTNNNVK